MLEIDVGDGVEDVGLVEGRLERLDQLFEIVAQIALRELPLVLEALNQRHFSHLELIRHGWEE